MFILGSPLRIPAATSSRLASDYTKMIDIFNTTSPVVTSAPHGRTEHYLSLWRRCTFKNRAFDRNINVVYSTRVLHVYIMTAGVDNDELFDAMTVLPERRSFTFVHWPAPIYQCIFCLCSLPPTSFCLPGCTLPRWFIRSDPASSTHHWVRLDDRNKRLHENLIACGLPDQRATPESYIQPELAGLPGGRHAAEVKVLSDEVTAAWVIASPEGACAANHCIKVPWWQTANSPRCRSVFSHLQ